MTNSNEFESRLANYPVLQTRMSQILDIVENTQGDVPRADDAEDKGVSALRQSGREILTDWAHQCEAKTTADCQDERSLRRDKKNFVGTAVMAPSK